MKINLDTISSLDTSKSYYLSNTTGEIKEAGAWQKFKCFFGIGDGREKAAKLVEAVKDTLLQASNKIADANLNSSVRSLEDSRSRFFSVSGSSLTRLSRSFSVANAADIARKEAAKIANRPLNEAVKEVCSLLRIESGRLDDIMEVLKRAAKPLIDNPPMKADETGCRVLDDDAFKAELANVLEDAMQTMVDVSKSAPNGRARFDSAVRDAMFSTLYGPDGKRNKMDVSAMGSIADIRFRKVLANCTSYKPSAVTQEEFAASVRTLIDACGEDPDMLDAIEDTARRFLVTGNARLRTPEQIAKRVADCRANQKELFNAIGGDRALRNIARNLTKAYAGLALPPGTFTKTVEALKAVDLAPFQGLGENSDSVDIHNAVMALNKAVRTVLTKSGAMNHLDGQDEILPIRNFVEHGLLTRLSKTDLRGLSAALSTPLAARVAKFYHDYGTSPNKVPKNDLPEGVNKETTSQLLSLLLYVDELKCAVEQSLGSKTAYEPIKYADAKRAPNDAFYPANILEDVQKDSADFIAEKRETFLQGAVKGKSATAGIIRGLFADMIGPAPDNPANMAYGLLNFNTRRMMNTTIMRGAKLVMRGELQDTQLFKDLQRGMDVTLDGVGKLSTDFPTALNQIARFVTGRPDATFDTLDEVSKKKAAIVIGFLGQDSEKAVMDGAGFALDPKGDVPVISLVGDQSKDKKAYKLSFYNGQLNVNLKLTYQRPGILHRGDLIKNPAGFTFNGSFDYVISDREMNRLTALDLAAYDDTEAMAEFNSVGKNGVQENRIGKMFDKIPNPYQINANCKTYYDVEVHG